ncbi:MAG: amidase [Thainema sp.]
MSTPPHVLTATAAIAQLRSGQLSVQDLLSDCLQQIEQQEPQVQAWQYLQADRAMAAARQRDRQIAEQITDDKGNTMLPLQGVPVAIKDIMATYDMPTEWGTPIHARQQFGYDAAVVERLRAAGAIILGKTTTTEYASAQAPRTTNPHHPDHTPGGSSSGSAAAIAANMVPLALGTQTMGSVVRPAAYCGVFGFKPTFGTVSRVGIMPVSRDLDHVGWFARGIEDLALLYQVLAGSDSRDPDCWGGNLQSNWNQTINLAKPPKIALLQDPNWFQADAIAQSNLYNQAEALTAAGATVEPLKLPSEFDAYFDCVQVLMCSGLAANHGPDYEQNCDRMSPQMRELIERGFSYSAVDYAQARHAVVHYRQCLANVFDEYDAILTLATTGAAPKGLTSTGSPIFCALWTLCGLPALSLPTGKTDGGLPLAVQLVGPWGKDLELLRVASWMQVSSSLLIHQSRDEG